MALEDTPSPGKSGILQEFQQEQATLTERQPDGPAVQTQDSAIAQLENYEPRYPNYGELQEFQQEQATLTERQPDGATVQTQELQPTRPQQIREQGYVQGEGDYVSESGAAIKNDAMINRDYYAAAEAREFAADRSADRSYENDQTKEKRINELAERFATEQNTQSPEKQQEQER